ALAPLHPFPDRRPRLLAGDTAHDESEMTCAQGVFVDLRAGCGLADAAHGERLPDVVDLADECEDRAGDLGETHGPVVDDEPTADHAVVGDELAQYLRDGGTGPRHPPLGVEESALRLARQQ